LPFGEIDLDDLPVDPGLDRDHVVGLDRPDSCEEHGHFLGFNHSGRDRHAWSHRRRRVGGFDLRPQIAAKLSRPDAYGRAGRRQQRNPRNGDYDLPHDNLSPASPRYGRCLL
jgi:hypothetical protein